MSGCHLNLRHVIACVAALAVLCTGCQIAPKYKLVASESRNQALSEQVKAQLAEIENLKTHTRQLEDRLIASERQAAAHDARVSSNDPPPDDEGIPEGIPADKAQAKREDPSARAAWRPSRTVR